MLARALTVAIATLTLTGCAAVQQSTQTDLPGKPTDAIVDRILDGDTLALRDGGRVRLVQIDTPERRSNECGNQLATTALERLAPAGSRIQLEADPTLDDVDRYGRLLRYVRNAHGQLVNLELARQGVAAPYFYRGDRGTHATAIATAARDAKRRQLGAWGTCPNATLDPGRAWSTGT
jgi:micrococcal nuclease